MSEAVKVMVRVRPMSEGEKSRGCKSIIDIDDKTHSLVLHKKGNLYFSSADDPDGSKQFTFDHVFSSTTAQQYIYEQTTFPLVESVVEGYNGTIFAYGQTGIRIA
jgi:Kinesin motor domain